MLGSILRLAQKYLFTRMLESRNVNVLAYINMTLNCNMFFFVVFVTQLSYFHLCILCRYLDFVIKMNNVNL